jgi:D-alanine-D-alanine ligase-like ATP-grasp enzyme
MGVHVCKTFQSLVDAFQIGVNEKVAVLVEEFIKGREATCGVVDNLRNVETYSLLQF